MELEGLIKAGKDMGFEGGDLQKFVAEQQAVLRDERCRERDKDREDREARERELQLQVELEKTRGEANETRSQSLVEGGLSKVSGYMPKLPPFDQAKDDIDSFLQRFERFATSCKWEKAVWGVAVSSLLTGKALQVYANLPTDDAEDYNVLKQALLKAFEFNAEGFHKKFRESRPHGDESGSQFGARLKTYLHRWLDLSKVPCTYEAICEFFLCEQFNNSIREDLQVFLKERGSESTTFRESCELADKFIDAHACPLSKGKPPHANSAHKASAAPAGSSTNSMRCFKCNKVGHTWKLCKGQPQSADRRCFLCNKVGHIAKDCLAKQANTGSGGKGRRDVVALCSEIDDRFSAIDSNVTQGQLQLASGDKIPITCGGCEAHSLSIAENLPTALGIANDQEVTVLRDSGCTSAVIKASLVQPDQFTGDAHTCVLVDGSVRCFPIAKVSVATPFYSGEVEAMAMKDPICELIIGNIPGAEDPGILRSDNCVGKNLASEGEQVDPSLVVESCNQNPSDVIPGGSLDGQVLESVESGQSDRINDVQTPRSTALANGVTTRSSAKEQSTTRNLKVPRTVESDHVDFKETQAKDPEITKLKELEGKTFKRGKGIIRYKYEVQDGILLRVVWGYKNKPYESTKQLVVPKALRADVLRLAHASAMAGHLSTKKTLDRICSSFYWPSVGADVRRFCRSCDVCQKACRKHNVPRAPLGSMPIIEVPFKRVSVDLVGPIIPSSNSGNRYILVLVDHATRYPEAVALKSIETTTIAEELLNIFSRVGFPEEILSDRGTQFVSELMREVSRLVSIKQIFTTPYNPRCNGLVERMNGTLKEMIKKLCTERPRDWDRYIPAALFAYREVPQASTGFSPFALLYGRVVRGPMQILKEVWTAPDSEQVHNTYQYVVELRNKIEDTCRLAQESLQQAKEQYKHHYDKTARERSFEKGDKVLLLLPKKKNKLEMKWQGPFEVVERKNSLDYCIRMKGKLKVYHLNLLKKYVTREESSNENCASFANLPRSVESVEPIELVESVELCEGSEDNELEEFMEFPGSTQCETFHDVKLSEGLTSDQKQSCKEILKRFSGVFTDVPGTTNLIEHEIKLSSNEVPRNAAYPIPFALREKVDQEIDMMLEQDIIEMSDSPYNAGVVCVGKKDGNLRVCTDFRKLNSITLFDPEPMPDVDFLLAKVENAKYFSSFDCSKGYWQIPVSEESRGKTAFSTMTGHYHYKKMAFGLVNSAATFNRLMRKLLLGLDNVVNFIDDILVYSETWEEHEAALEALFARIQEAGLTLKPSKTYVGCDSVKYLGFIVGGGQIMTDDDKVSKIQGAPRPETKTEVRSFLGIIGFYRRFVPNFAAIALPLTNLTKKGKADKVVWGREEEQAFVTLKKTLLSSPVLKLPDLDEEFILQTDASNTGVGAVLLQVGGDTKLPVAFASRKLLPRESRYSTIERECLAILFAVRKFHKFLYGRKFTLETDHKPLTYMHSLRNTNNRIMRWALFLQDYLFDVKHVKGKENVTADYLSRIRY